MNYISVNLYRKMINHANQDVAHDLEEVTGRKAIDFKEFSRKTAALGIWNQRVPQSI